MNSDKRRRRHEETHPKRIYLTPFGLDKVKQWAQDNHLNFSAAIETLALLGLADERADYIIPAVRATTLQGIRLTFNRIARLLSDIAIESAASRTLTEGVMLQLIREVAQARPDDFERIMRVQRDSRLEQDQRIRTFHDAIKHNVEQEAIRRLRQPIARVAELFTEEEEDE